MQHTDMMFFPVISQVETQLPMGQCQGHSKFDQGGQIQR